MSSIASAPTTGPGWATQSIFRPFPLPQTGRQWFYLLFLQGKSLLLTTSVSFLANTAGFGAGIIDFGANFAIAYGMYGHQKDVRMWVFSKNTIAGDLGVTPIIQTCVSMLISSTLVHTDLHHNAIQPLPFVYPHVEHLPDPRELFDRIFRTRRKHRTEEDIVLEKQRELHNSMYPNRGFRYYFWMLVRFAFEGTEMNMIVAKCGPRNWALRLLWTAAQGALLGIIFGFPLWCLAITILGPIYGKGNMGATWAPQAIKGVYGCIVGWVTNPVIAALALGSQADHHILVVPVDPEAGPADNMATIAEEGEPPVDADSIPPSPFLHPFRPATTSAITGRPRANTGASQRSRAGSVQLTGPRLTPTRSRSNSVVSLRPPLTANVSYMGPAPLPPASSPATPRTPVAARPRGLTVSSYMSATITTTTPTGASPGTQYAYALGGHGGRAKRSRSNTTATLPNSAILGLGRPAGVTPNKDRVASSPATPGGTPGDSGSPRLPKPLFTRERTNSDVAGGASHAEMVARGCDDAPVNLEPSHDVFGSTNSSVPMLRVQRPSLEMSSNTASGSTPGSSPRRSSGRRDSFEGPLGELRE